MIDLCIAEVGRVQGGEPLPHCAVHLLPPNLVLVALLNNGDLVVYEMVFDAADSAWRLWREPQRHVTRVSEAGRRSRRPQAGYLSRCIDMQGKCED